MKGNKNKSSELTMHYTLEVSDTIKGIGDNYDLEDLRKTVELIAKKKLKVDDVHVKNFKAFYYNKEE